MTATNKRTPSSNKKTLKLGDLKENPENPRLQFTEDQGKAFAAAYAKFGDLGPVVANRRFDFRLVGGHKRKGALSDAFPNAAIILEDERSAPDEQGTVAWGWIDTGKGRYALRVVDWDAETEAAANLAANQFSSEFDMDKVGALLKQIDGKVDLSLTGFNAQEALEIINSVASGPTALKEHRVATPPKLAWVLISIPLVRYGEIQESVERIGKVAASVHTTYNDREN